MTVKQAIVLRVHRNVAGVSFPWDCVYLFRRSEELLLPKIFPCSLVITMTEAFTYLLKKAVRNPRGDSEDGRGYPFSREDEETLAAYVKRHPPMDAVFDNPQKFIALVPTLHLRGNHPADKTGPVYLTARPRAAAQKSTDEKRYWAHKTRKWVYKTKGLYTSSQSTKEKILKNLVHPSLSAGAYFLYYGNKIEPPCLCCPNSLDLLDGKCVFGTQKCYTALENAKDGDFVTALKVYKEVVHERNTEPEVTDEQLQDDTC